jgi:hypothetical protein
MPQFLWRKSRLNIQGGAGVSRFQGVTRFQLGWRLSREF